MSDPAVSQVIAAIAAVFSRKAHSAPPLAPETPIDGSLGLDSLDFAEVVVRLEQAFGFDPFSSRAIDQLRTIDDLAALYRR